MKEEKMGEGWDKIIDNFKNSKYEVKMPEIIDTKNTVVVKIFSPKEMIEEEISIGHKSDRNRTQIRHRWILKYLKTHKEIRNSIVAKEFLINRDTARNDLNKLIEQGKIIKKGAGNNVWYELK